MVDVGYILEYSNRATARSGEVDAASCLSICVGKNHTHLWTQTHIHAPAIVIHSTVRFSMSYPVSAVGSCPNKGALHSFTVLLSFVSHTNIFSSQSNTSILERESGRRYFLWPNQGVQPQTNKVLLQWIMLSNWKTVRDDLKWVYESPLWS